ncbi:MAG: hypothetical protein KAJ75_03015 [Alphaproteobacteria bacterium]|nr:hypothetical protein [Alphaproteobacteria bacterium]
MKKRIVALTAIFYFISSMAFANDMLFISPTRVNLDDKTRIKTIHLHNKSNSAKTYQIIASDIIMTENGSTASVDNFEYSAKRLIRYVPRRVEIEPDGRRSIKVMSRIRGDLADGEYHTHLFFNDITAEEKQKEKESQEKEKSSSETKNEGGKISIHIGLAFSMAIPITISHGEADTTVSLEKAEFERIKNNDFIKVHMTRKGNGQGLAYMDVFYSNATTNEKTKIYHSVIRIYRELDKIIKQIPLKNKEKLTSGKLKVVLYSESDANENDKDKIIGTAFVDIP